MHRTTTLPRDWWDLTAETSVGNPAEQDVAALRAEIDQLRRALAGRAVIDQACGMVMVLAPAAVGRPVTCWWICHGSATPNFRRWLRPWSPPGRVSRSRG